MQDFTFISEWRQYVLLKIVDQEKEGCVIETVALDELIDERVTFLKMDIEGAEAEAIKGAKNIIQKDKPKLAICIYHKPNDLWEIPLMIHELVGVQNVYPAYGHKVLWHHFICNFVITCFVVNKRPDNKAWKDIAAR